MGDRWVRRVFSIAPTGQRACATIRLKEKRRDEKIYFAGDVNRAAENNTYDKINAPVSFEPANRSQCIEWRWGDTPEALEEPGLNLCAHSTVDYLLKDRTQHSTFTRVELP